MKTTKVKVTVQSTSYAVFVKGANNKMPAAIYAGLVRKSWSTAGHVNLSTKTVAW